MTFLAETASMSAPNVSVALECLSNLVPLVMKPAFQRHESVMKCDVACRGILDTNVVLSVVRPCFNEFSNA